MVTVRSAVTELLLVQIVSTTVVPSVLSMFIIVPNVVNQQ